MKLTFRKKDEEISVQCIEGDKETGFSYIDMIKSLIHDGKLDDPEIGEGFSEEETKSIRSMFALINKTVESLSNEKTESVGP